MDRGSRVCRRPPMLNHVVVDFIAVLDVDVAFVLVTKGKIPDVGQTSTFVFKRGRGRGLVLVVRKTRRGVRTRSAMGESGNAGGKTFGDRAREKLCASMVRIDVYLVMRIEDSWSNLIMCHFHLFKYARTALVRVEPVQRCVAVSRRWRGTLVPILPWN